jgi:uncharacterized protein YqjF (DUF2071 family)
MHRDTATADRAIHEAGNRKPQSAFLAADWRHLAILSYAVPPSLLAARVPPGTELESFYGKTFVSLVGFRFLNTKLRGIPIPFHSDFEEMNLRFYVRRWHKGVVKHGVVFIQQIVPRRAVAAIARWVYHEHYRCLPMTHHIARDADGLRLAYSCRLGSGWNQLTVRAQAAARPMTDGSLEQCIAEHYWGYCAQPDGGTMEYQVAHPPWRIWDVTDAQWAGDAGALYAPEFAGILNRSPDSAFLAEGSPVIVYAGTNL